MISINDIYIGARFGLNTHKCIYECTRVDDRSAVVHGRKTRSDGKKFGKDIGFNLSDIDFIQTELFRGE